MMVWFRCVVWIGLMVGAVPSHALDVFTRNQPLQHVLPQLAAELGKSVVIDERVSANVTLSIRDATWPQILEAIAEQLQLQLIWRGDIAILAPRPVSAHGDEKIGVAQSCEHTIWHLKYAKAAIVGGYLQQYFSDLSTIVDPRTNGLMTHYCGDPQALSMALEWLDSPTRQIEIAAEIAQVSDTVQEQFGVNWHAQLLNPSSTLNGDIGLDLAAAPVNLGISGVSGNLRVSTMLDWLERHGSASVIARPKIVTAEGQPAKIESGTEVPYQVVDDDNVSVEFRQAGLMLEVTPEVKDDATLLLTLKIHQDSVGEMVNGVPSIETNRVQTQVEVKNGETLVLGGIFRDETFVNVSKVPLLGDVPLLGALFRQEREQQEKVELLVFITPKLLKMSVN